MKNILLLASLFGLGACASARVENTITQEPTPEQKEATDDGDKVCDKINKPKKCFVNLSRKEYNAAYIESGADLMDCAVDYISVQRAQVVHEMIEAERRADLRARNEEKRERDESRARTVDMLVQSIGKELTK